MRNKCHRRQSQHNIHSGEHPVRGAQPDDMQYRADRRGHPNHREIWPANRRAEREQHGCVSAGDDEEDVRIIDAAQYASHLRAAPRHDVQQRAVAEQQHGRGTVHCAGRFDRAGRRDADEYDGRRDAQRQGGEVKPSAQSRLAIAECIHGDDLALDRLQCGLGLAVARLRGPVSGRCTVQCGGVGACAGFLTRGCGRRNCCGGSHGSSRWRADGNAHTDYLAMAGDALPTTNLRYRNLV